jgi:hypothetical protein
MASASYRPSSRHSLPVPNALPTDRPERRVASQPANADGSRGQAVPLLRHKRGRGGLLLIEAVQHGHRDRVATSATVRRRRRVATELGT